MAPARRKLLLPTLLFGAGLTLAVILLDALGWLAPLDNWFYDQRALHCQQFAPAPTTQLVHLDVDDRALDVIGRWPWPRSKLAIILDELVRARPKAVATDIIFPEPEGLTYAPAPDGSIRATDNDALCAAALRRLDCAVVPAALFSGKSIVSPLAVAMLDELTADVELGEGELVDRLRRRGFTGPSLAADARAIFFPVQREAIFARVGEVVATSAATRPADAVRTLLPHVPDDVAYASPLVRAVREQFDRVAAIDAMQRLAPPKPQGAPPLVKASGSFYAPIRPFAEAARGTGFVDFFSDSVVRTVPLLAEHDGRVYPQLGLALALRFMDVDPAKLRFTDRSLTIPLAGCDVTVPLRTDATATKQRVVPLTMDIPWFGTRDWTTMYDHPAHRRSLQHLPVLKLWDLAELRRKLRHDDANADVALSVLLDNDQEYKLGLKVDVARAYFANRPPLDDPAPRRALAERARRELEDAGLEAAFAEMDKAGTLAGNERRQRDEMRAALGALNLLLPEAAGLEREIDQQQRELDQQLAGKAVILGWTATGAAADFVPTPLHAKCPGVVVHGAVFNAIVTGHFWRRVPAWLVYGATLVLGLLTAYLAVNLSAPLGLACSAAVLLAYLAINGLILFGKLNLLAGVAAPVLTIAFVWAMCTLYRIIIETREREHIKARFSTYADPVLLEYVLAHPEKVQFDGEVRELTVVFTDLANFTTLSEKLGEKSVALLNDYLGRMVPIIRERKGYLNKFLGDGIMWFYGAPVETDQHAAYAVQAALDMQAAMREFNQNLAEQGLPPLAVRAGISTGKMVVGDAGTAGRADYTVLGDAVNFGSRLEGANKALGTRVLVSGRTAECAASQFLFRPVGRLQVVGKTEGIDCFEALAPADRATDADRRNVELTVAVIEAFKARRFQECLNAIPALAQHVGGPSKLTKLYHDLAERYLREPPAGDWDGTISLTEK
jgi:class 3 adenylate cyclase/CHASE2 domain-containing sensor protein